MEAVANTFSNNLINQFNWFETAFLPALKKSSDEFFVYNFDFSLMSLSLNINAMFQDDSYFVTKINIEEKQEVFIRCSEKAIGLILEKILEPTETEFNLNSMSELEAKIITNFNDFFFNSVSPYFQKPAGTLKFKTFDILHLTYLMKAKDDINNKNVAKIIVSVPYQFLSPEEFKQEKETFSDKSFKSNNIEANVRVGTTLFSVKDLKNLEAEDIVVFENSNLQTMKIISGVYEKNFNITPNPALIIAVNDTDEGENMESTELNLWDSIQIEMNAEFDKIKMPLGELKKIEEGLVIDVSSIYNNKITLKVEDKSIAQGELVIVNDRYGVKISEVFAKDEEEEPEETSPQMQENVTAENIQPEYVQPEEQMQEQVQQSPEQDFDYSDFELDDEDI